jgi:hypothetical protein
VRADFSHHFEGGVGDVVGDDAGHRQLGATVDLHVLEVAAELLRQVAQEGVGRLVVVLVRVVDGVVGLDHGLVS